MTRLKWPHARRTAEALLFAVVLTLAWGPAAGADTPSATISPARGLIDGQRTTIRASGLPANSNVEVLECNGTAAAPPKDLTYCDGFTADTTGYSDAQGRYLNTPGDKAGGTSGYRIWVLPTTREAGVTIRCGAKDPCVLYVGVNFEDFREPHTFVPLNFAPSAVSTAQTSAVAASPSPSRRSSGGSSAPWLVVLGVVVVVAGGGATVLVRRGRREGRHDDRVADQASAVKSG